MAAVAKKGNVQKKQICKYGSQCYRKNPQHLKNFSHPEKEEEIETSGTDSNRATKKTKRTIEDFFHSKDSHDPSDSDNESEDAISKRIKTDSAGSSTDLQTADSNLESADSDITVPKESDLTDVSVPSPEEVRENIKRKFLVEMPEDFYQFWDFCKRQHPKDPTNALADSLNLYLVGPFDILQSKHKGVTKNKHGRQPNYLLHYRYFYDPPEFQTVLTTKDKSLLHFGYYRDDPKEAPVSVASNTPGENSKEKISHCGDNIFAAIYNHASKMMKTSLGEKRKLLEKLMKSLEEEATKLDLSLAASSKRMKDRQKKVVCPTFHGAGIVVPVDANDVGYRPVPETPASLRAMLKKIVESKTEAERDKSFDGLQEIITYVQFANDECDYGEGLELGLDLFSYGSTVFHPQISTLLPLAYQLLKRSEFSKIIEAHLKCRRGLSESVDELEC